MASGYLYALANDSMPNVFKVGCTSRNPFERAKELRTTGVPTPFFVVAAVSVSDIKKAEAVAHTLLVSKGKRIKGDREFFKIPLGDIVQAFAQVVSSATDSLVTETLPITHEQILADALIYHYGYQNTSPDIKQAIRLYEQAAQMGSTEALGRLSFMYTEGSGVRKNREKATYYASRAEELINARLEEYLISCSNPSIRYFLIESESRYYGLALGAAYDAGDIEGLRCIFPKFSRFPHNDFISDIGDIEGILSETKTTEILKSQDWLLKEVVPFIPKSTILHVLADHLDWAKVYSSSFYTENRPELGAYKRESIRELAKFLKALESQFQTNIDYDSILLLKDENFKNLTLIDVKSDIVSQMNSQIRRLIKSRAG